MAKDNGSGDDLAALSQRELDTLLAYVNRQSRSQIPVLIRLDV